MPTFFATRTKYPMKGRPVFSLSRGMMVSTRPPVKHVGCPWGISRCALFCLLHQQYCKQVLSWRDICSLGVPHSWWEKNRNVELDLGMSVTIWVYKCISKHLVSKMLSFLFAVFTKDCSVVSFFFNVPYHVMFSFYDLNIFFTLLEKLLPFFFPPVWYWFPYFFISNIKNNLLLKNALTVQ